MSFNYAIENKYITDYTVWLPSIHEDNSTLEAELDLHQIDSTIRAKSIYLFSCLLNTGSKKCIIYCRDINEIDEFMEVIKNLDEYFTLGCSMNKITSYTKQKERTEILNNFASKDNRQLLFSVRILDECIDIPSCDSVYLSYPTTSKIRTIQRMSRATRIDKTNPNKISNIFVWCADEYVETLEILSGIKEYDIEFKDKIKVNEIGFTKNNNNCSDSVTNDKEFVNNYLIGIKSFKLMSWTERLEQLKLYLKINGKKPSKYDNDCDIKRLQIWQATQKRNYNIDIKKCKQSMKNEIIKKKWEDFINDDSHRHMFLLNKDVWKIKLDQAKSHILANNKKKDAKISMWLNHQKNSYDTYIDKCKYIMRDEEIKNLWENFVNNDEYAKNILSSDDIWIFKFNQVKEYIKNNHELPQYNDNKILYRWLNVQKNNYSINIEECGQIMRKNEFKKMWEDFVNDDEYKKLSISNKDVWIRKLAQVKNYILVNGKRPSSHDIDVEIKYVIRC
jgi:superfamily II DNA/RNA helicase